MSLAVVAFNIDLGEIKRLLGHFILVAREKKEAPLSFILLFYINRLYKCNINSFLFGPLFTHKKGIYRCHLGIWQTVTSTYISLTEQLID